MIKIPSRQNQCEGALTSSTEIWCDSWNTTFCFEIKYNIYFARWLYRIPKSTRPAAFWRRARFLAIVLHRTRQGDTQSADSATYSVKYLERLAFATFATELSSAFSTCGIQQKLPVCPMLCSLTQFLSYLNIQENRASVCDKTQSIKLIKHSLK